MTPKQGWIEVFIMESCFQQISKFVEYLAYKKIHFFHTSAWFMHNRGRKFNFSGKDT
jgi:hypothetical protein